MRCALGASAVGAAAVLAGCVVPAPSAPSPMSFFLTSVGMNNGADLGGLAGADAHCQRLATQAGAGARTWRAYLSVQAPAGQELPKAVDARERIGKGPWHNAAGVLIGSDIEHLHGPRNGLNADTALSERGARTPGAMHDILTGTRIDGTAPSSLDIDMTCGNWTRSGEQGAALVGHFDRASAIREAWATSWNSAHLTRGCSAAAIKELGSGGLFYCFAQ
jgi:hypothetical protein